MNARFERIDRRLNESFAAITQQFVEQRAYTDFAYERLDRADQSLSAGISRLERKLDRILALVVESRARRPELPPLGGSTLRRKQLTESRTQ